MTAESELPALPEPAGVLVFGARAMRGFIADQMQEYATAARAPLIEANASLSAANAALVADKSALLSRIAEIEGIRPELPPRPPSGEGLPRYGLRWNGPTEPLAVPIEDGYWTPWHLADTLRAELEAVLSDWNALVAAIGSPTNGGAVGHARAVIAELERKTASEDALQSANASLRADAERYRWIKAQGHRGPFYFSATGQVHRDDLDAAIDAARAAHSTSETRRDEDSES